MAHDLRSERSVRELLRDAEGKQRAPAYLYAAPGVAWWFTWIYCATELGRMSAPGAWAAGMIAALPLLLLSVLAAAFGLASLATLRVRLGYRLLLLAINVSGPIWMFSSR